MSKYLLIFLIFLVLPLLASCKIEYNSPQSARDDNYGVGYGSSGTTTDDKTSGTIVAKTGMGDDVITNIALKKGPAVFQLKYSGNSDFKVKLLDSDGDLIADLAEKSGAYSGKVFAQIPKDADNYVLIINASGSWEVNNQAMKEGEYK
ncbi:hypothetical protein [Enterococcus wangshanyuanii]|uniref:Lipoprotein n=1 Tax=Enterococcus wangshanyuanii TaxID=2005703 RepID=A0ABQ1NVB7_9ENTE|nr:hypothetical protein [Enterococcus wangshanyuanii]GGC83638.1 hypothetical protein GCM10011573_11570 [Enterococcus wangshanyuanii]